MYNFLLLSAARPRTVGVSLLLSLRSQVFYFKDYIAFVALHSFYTKSICMQCVVSLFKHMTFVYYNVGNNAGEADGSGIPSNINQLTIE